MSLAHLFVLDLVAITLLAFGIYYPRHRRRDLVVSFVAMNVAVLGVTQALASAEVSAGLGLGLFGVLSIIRLRSAEMDHNEIAYYISSLALGLLGGFRITPSWLSPALMGAVVLSLAVADHPRLLNRYRVQSMTLDRAFTSEAELRAHLEGLLHAQVHSLNVRRIDFVHETTNVEVRYRPLAVDIPNAAYAAAEFEVSR